MVQSRRRNLKDSAFLRVIKKRKKAEPFLKKKPDFFKVLLQSLRFSWWPMPSANMTHTHVQKLLDKQLM